jgi:ribose transport system permease protein
MSVEARVLAPDLGSRLRRHGPVILVYAVAGALAIAATVVNPGFLDPGNLLNILRQSIPLGLVAIGQTFVVLTGGIDFSVGPLAGLVAVSAALLFEGDPANAPLAMAAGIGIGAASGLVIGVIIARLNAMPFIATFGMASLLTGITLTVASGPTGLVPYEFVRLYDVSIGTVPLVVIAMAGVWLLAWFVLKRLRYGRYVYGVGDSEESARRAGIRVGWIVTSVYVVSGVLAALAGLFLLARSGVGAPTFGEGFDFLSVTAITIGGISLYGGRGNIWGTLGGVLLLTMVSNVFNVTQVDVFYQRLLLGVIVLAAVALYKPRVH